MSAKFAKNRKAYFNYEIIEKITAGIELLGFEVKSIKAGRMSLDGSYAIIRGNE
ncbi:MAG: SsrA-binding protein, partial [bacterium]